MNLIKNKKIFILLFIIIFLYFFLSFFVAFSAFSIGDEVYESTPESLGISYEENNISTSKSSLSTWWIPNNSDITLIMLHGLRSQKADQEMLGKIAEFNNLGYSIIAIDFRNHGKSGVGDFTFGVDEVNDVFQTIEYYRDAKDLTRFGIWGFSYGGTTALLTGLDFNQQNLGVEIVGIFAESPYMDLLAVFTDQVAYRTPLNTAMANLLKPGTVLLSNLIYNFEFNSVQEKFDSSNGIVIPTILISCGNDEIIPKGQIQDLQKLLGINSYIEEFNDCRNHGDALQSDSDKYRSLLLNLFKS